MKANLLTLFTILVLASCAAQKKDIKTGVLKGSVGEYIGNCMPAPNRPSCKPQPISAKIMITRLSRDFSLQLLVDSVESNHDGNFEINLPGGSYSLFIKDDGTYVCTGISCPSDCYCTPFEIVADSATTIKVTLDHATW